MNFTEKCWRRARRSLRNADMQVCISQLIRNATRPPFCASEAIDERNPYYGFAEYILLPPEAFINMLIL